MRSKLVAALFAGLFMAGTAVAQTPVAPVAPAPALDPQNVLNLDLSTGGRVQILLRPDKAPNSVERIKTLVRRHFYDGLIFHRVIEGFMAQGGDPKGTGEGGSDLPDLKAEFNDLPHVRGAMAMARAQDPNSANSQFYIMLQPNLTLDNNYTVIGRVFAGMQFVDALEKGEPPANPSKVVHASIESDDLGQPPVALTPPAAEVTPAAVESKADRKAREKTAKQEKKAAEKAAKEEKKRLKEESKPGELANPAAAVGGEAAATPGATPSAPQGTDAAVQAVAGEQPTDQAVREVASEEAVPQPQ